MSESTFQLGTPVPEDSVKFFECWFSEVPETSLVSVVRIKPMEPGAISITLPLETVKDAIDVSGLNDLVWGEEDSIYDLYYGVATMTNVPKRGKRGGLKDVGLVPGVWLDIDVKEGSFESEEAAKTLVRSAPIPPSIVVTTGTGGVHAYWKLTEPVDCATAKDLCTRWWALMSDIAYPASIDKLCDPSRVMRLPGSIRWPKKVPEVVSTCRLEFTSPNMYDKKQILDLTEMVWAAHLERIRQVKSRVENGKSEANEVFLEHSQKKTGWAALVQLANLEGDFNDTYSWESLLQPLGWTQLGVDDEKRVLWSRPGDGRRKSATTDWPDSPHIMSLFSSAPETGLADIHESGITLTKYRVWVQLFWDGNERAAVESLLS